MVAICIEIDGFCIKNDEFCIKHDAFCTGNDVFNANVQVSKTNIIDNNLFDGSTIWLDLRLGVPVSSTYIQIK